MRLRDLLRLALATGLAAAVAATVLAGTYSYTPDPNDPLYRGSLCRHSPTGK